MTRSEPSIARCPGDAGLINLARWVTPVLVVVAALVTSGAISSFTLAADNLERLVGS